MNKDEITEKAQELTIKNVTDGKDKYYSWGYYNGCIVGLEYNKKRIAELESQIEKMKSDVMRNVKWADQNKNGQMYCKLNAMINQWEIKEND